MSKSKKKKETKAVIAGQIAFWVSFLGIISLPIPGFWRFVGGFAIASGLKKLIETMATPLDGLHTENGERVKEEPVIQVGTPEDQRAKEVVAGGLDLLSQIAAEREQIDEFVMTRRLKDLDELVRKMLQTVVDDPNEASRMRKFMSYYLPTTLKLLQSYRTMKTRGVSYSEMNTTRENLIHALDMILQAAQKQLDAMHKDDMLDMSADMDVLEQMLKRDGYMESVLSESLKEANRQQNASVPYSTQQADLHTSGTAAARQMNQGAPVLKMPEEDIPEADRQQKKFYQNSQLSIYTRRIFPWLISSRCFPSRRMFPIPSRRPQPPRRAFSSSPPPPHRPQLNRLPCRPLPPRSRRPAPQRPRPASTRAS